MFSPVNNAEKRLGLSAVVVPFVWASAWFAIYQYSKTAAGWLLAPLGVWLTIASCLVIQTWRINYDSEGKRDTLFPRKYEEKVTVFRWEK